MVRRIWTGIALAGLIAGGASANQPNPLAEAHARGTTVDWTVLTPYQRAVLTVSMPDGEVARSEVGPGAAPTFSAFDEKGEERPDGAYNWELRLDPILPSDVERRLAAALSRGDERAVRRIQRAHGLERDLVQSGTFVVSGGAFVDGEETQPEVQAPAKGLASVTAADQVIADDLIVRGNACVGSGCSNGMSFSTASLVVKSPLPNLFFEDTSSASTTVDWALFVNGFFSGNMFSLSDLSNGTTPFTITAGAPNGSIFADTLGRVGLGTSTPAARLHIKHGLPTIRLERTNPSFPVQIWDIRNNVGDFAIADMTEGGTPFSIEPGAAPSSVYIAAGGNVGIGTPQPEAALHVIGGVTTDTFIGIGPNPDGNPPDQSALNIGHAGGSYGRGAGFLNVRPDSGAAAPNPSLRFLIANTQRMILDNEGFLGLGVGNPANPIEHTSGAVLTAGGTWQSVSSRAAKRDIRPLEASDALAALRGLAPVRFYYKAEPSDEYVGFVAEDVPDLVATADHQRLGPLDIVAVLTKVVQEQETALKQQQATIDELAARLRELERQR